MRKVKLSDSELRLLLVFLAVLMLAGAYFLSFQKNVERAQEIEALNEEDRAFVELLESMVARRPEIEAQTEEYRQTIRDIIAKYPSYVPTEKAIEIIQQLENRTGVHMKSIGFSMAGLVVSLDGYSWVENEEGEFVSTDASSVGYRDTLSMSYEAKYDDFKNMVAYIDSLTDRTTIPSITASYDNSTGNVSGAVTVNMYYLTETGKEYVEPDITGIRKGLSNIFTGGTAAVQVKEDEDESEEENEE